MPKTGPPAHMVQDPIGAFQGFYGCSKEFQGRSNNKMGIPGVFRGISGVPGVLRGSRTVPAVFKGFKNVPWALGFQRYSEGFKRRLKSLMGVPGNFGVIPGISEPFQGFQELTVVI